MSGWRDIDSAPKDGTVILVYLKKEPSWRQYVVPKECEFYAIGFWEYQSWRSIEVEDCGSMGGEYTGWMPDWVCIDIDPTHWMPLPKPPE
jgi:hypothetical protein